MPRHFSEIARGRDNNLNLIRMIAATAVLVSHSYPISLGHAATEPLQDKLGTSLGHVAVLIFFAISGFLIAKSYDTRGDWRTFLLARAARLFPALAFVLLLTVLVGGAFLTVSSADEYWVGAGSYLLRNLSLAKLQYELPGVFLGNPYGQAINGSLWTLFYEVLCYLAVLIVGLAGLLSNRFAARALALANLVFLAVIQFVEIHDRIEALTTLAAPFSIGAAIYVWRDKVAFSGYIAALLWVPALALANSNFFPVVFSAALSYNALYLGFAPFKKLLWYNRLGDFSYGTYVFAFPIQQLVASWGISSPHTNIVLALPIVLVMAALSWHFVEAPSLNFYRRLAKRGVVSS